LILELLYLGVSIIYPQIQFVTKCRVGVHYDKAFQFNNPVIKQYKKEKIKVTTKKNEIEKDHVFNFDVNDTLLSSELSYIRNFMLKKLLDLLDNNNALPHGMRGRNFNLFQNCYTDIGGIIELISITLGKTECDLLQILVTVLKGGGYNGRRDVFFNNATNYVSPEILGYDARYGNSLRVISHNDLTASIITYFMLIFGYNKWVPNANNNTYGIIPYDGNTGKNELAFLNDTRLSRFAVGNYIKLKETYYENFLSFKCVKFDDCIPHPLLISDSVAIAVASEGENQVENSMKSPKTNDFSSPRSNAVAKSQNTGRKRKLKIDGGSNKGGTRRVKLHKNDNTRKHNKIMKKRTIKHHRKKNNTKRM
jgi:hypothetical protein